MKRGRQGKDHDVKKGFIIPFPDNPVKLMTKVIFFDLALTPDELYCGLRESMAIVTGPSLTRCTCMSAANCPVCTCGWAARACATK